MSYEYSENILVQESAADLLHDELGWETVFAYNSEILGADGTLGRQSYREVLLTGRFHAALKRLNPWITEPQIREAQQQLESHLSTASLLQINEENYFLIRDGIPVTVPEPGGEIGTRMAIVLDFQNPEANDFLAVREMKIHGDLYRRRTDIVGFVNGLPLLFIELKRHDVAVRNAYIGNYEDYLETIPALFYYNAFLILSNGLEAKVGTLGSKYEFFHEWKRLQESDEGSVALETMLRGICNKANFLDLFENFILFDHSSNPTAKILARNHQYLGVNAAVEAYAARKLRNGKLGVFWHTQGSGKSYSMLFLAQKIRRKFTGTPTIVILTDRDELNTQISETFENCGLLGKSKAAGFVAASGEDLVRRLQGNPGFIFTLIQKFNRPEARPIYPEHDILIMSDEAHRSQYGIFADNMMSLLPTASRIGFTGTPLMSDDNITERTFGGYVSVYDFRRAVEDGATVPLYYENRADKIKQLESPKITEEILAAIEDADLDERQQARLEADFAKEIHLLTAEPRLRAIARDFVSHYSDLWTTGKAMFVCLNKVTCVRMYNFVQEYWQEEIQRLQKLQKTATQQESMELARKIQWMQETEMAVVISQEQNEAHIFEAWGLDILPHRKKIQDGKLEKSFKDRDNPLRVVFVCAMWLTGFDVKCLSCMYLDKPLRAHTLMQTIARANRVAEGKSNGLIVDYIGIVKALRKALSDYTVSSSGTAGTEPTVDKEELLARIRELIATLRDLLAQNDFQLDDLVQAENFRKLALLQDAADAMCRTAAIKKTFQMYASELRRLVRYAGREDLTEDDRAQKDALLAIQDALQPKEKYEDCTKLRVKINEIINTYVQVDTPEPGLVPSRQFDISRIDFDLLRREFANARRKNLILRDMEALIETKLGQMLEENSCQTRIDYYERYQKIIEEYNSEQDQAMIEKTFIDLMNLSNSMDEEQQRYVREGFSSEEELSMYDLLFREDLSAKDIKKLKAVAVELLTKVKARISEFDHWADKNETKASVDNLIRDILWEELPESYDEAEITGYRQKVYEYFYTRYRAA